MKNNPTPRAWGLDEDAEGGLMIEGLKAIDLARRFGTPLHVVHESRLESTARSFKNAAESASAGRATVHYALKCNSIPAVVESVQRAGLGAEVMSPFELELALSLGFRGSWIVVNGPGKTAAFLSACIAADVQLINVDSLDEMGLLNDIAAASGRTADILLRINPDFVPRGMNSGSATGGRKGCAFGLDLKAGEVSAALDRLKELPRLRFRGYHFHIGTGIRDPRAHARVIERLTPLFRETEAAGYPVEVLDVGGGFAAMTTREMTEAELLLYQVFGRLPAVPDPDRGPTFADFARAIAAAVAGAFSPVTRPRLIYEPGRAIASPNQFLLLAIQGVKDRPGLRKWILTDGGLGTVSLPTFYECHTVFLANDLRRPRIERVTIAGPVCFASDTVYRNIRMPAAHPGEVIAIMDSGAYFIAQESNFGFPRPAVAGVCGTGVRLLRRRETFEDMTSRDPCIETTGEYRSSPEQEVFHEIRRH